MDIVFINNLRIKTIIGIYDWERNIKQEVSLDIEMATDIRPAAEEDAIEKTIDYKAVAKKISAYIEGSEFQLVETMAENVAALILNEFDIPWLRLRVNKPGALSNADDVGVIIERGTKPL